MDSLTARIEACSESLQRLARDCGAVQELAPNGQFDAGLQLIAQGLAAALTGWLDGKESTAAQLNTLGGSRMQNERSQ
jgi:hypothetical protein